MDNYFITISDPCIKKGQCCCLKHKWLNSHLSSDSAAQLPRTVHGELLSHLIALHLRILFTCPEKKIHLGANILTVLFLFKVIPRNSKWHLFCLKAKGILMSTFFLPDISVSFPDTPFGAGPVSYRDFYLNSILVSQICLIACLKTREMW